MNNERTDDDKVIEYTAMTQADLIVSAWDMGNRSGAAERFQQCAYRELVAALIARRFSQVSTQDLIDGIRFLTEHTPTNTNGAIQ